MSSKEEVFGSALASDTGPCHHSIELNRLRNSISFKVGNAITNSIKKPWLVPILPLKIVMLLAKHRKLTENSSPNQLESASRNCIIFFSSNNPNSKEFLRILSIAKMMKRIDPKQEIVFTSIYPLSESIAKGGISIYSIPRRHEFEEMGSSTWNSIIESTLMMAFNVHKPNIFLFDGKYPFRGMLNAIPTSNLMKIWLHRKPFINSMNKSIIQSIDKFDLIIQENEIFNQDGLDLVPFRSDIINCDPIYPLPYDPFNKQIQSFRVNCHESETVIYIELDKDVIDDSGVGESIKSLQSKPGLKLIFNDSRWVQSSKQNGFKGAFINSIHLDIDKNKIDFAIATSEYNHINELMMMNIPTLCLVNQKNDQQMFRAGQAAENGCVISIADDSPERMVSAAIERLLDEKVRIRMKSAGKKLIKPNGAAQVADWILKNKPVY
jgi:hypothetical protein